MTRTHWIAAALLVWSMPGWGQERGAIDGDLRSVASEEILLQAGRNTVLRIHLSHETEFFDLRGMTIDGPALHPGDRVSVQVRRDAPATALSVRLLREASDAERSAAERPVAESEIRTAEKQDIGRARLPRLIHKANPAYSEEARKARVSGTVLLHLIVDEQGQPTYIKIATHAGYGLDEKAIECVRKWRFAPATDEGRAVPCYSTVEINFRI